MQQISIRRGNLSDAEAIAECNAAMALETEGLSLDRPQLLGGVRAVLRDSSKGFYLVAELGGRAVGQMMITYEWSDWRNGVFWWIQSVYVEPDQRRTGVYTSLHQHVVEEAQRLGGVCGIRLYVEQENSIAQGVYGALGMNKTVYDMFEVDFVIQRQSGR
jgi:GNAT superfamily N-acetyltransferase